jgi:universal stress protein A
MANKRRQVQITRSGRAGMDPTPMNVAPLWYWITLKGDTGFHGGNSVATYRKILVAIDLTEEAPQVLEKAMDLGKAYGSDIVLVHVVEPVGYAYGGDIPMDLTELQDQLDKAAHEQLRSIGEKHGIKPESQLVLVGRPESEIHRLSEELGAELIVVGSHGRKGFQLLLGSTANGVLHGAICDVLAVRIYD